MKFLLIALALIGAASAIYVSPYASWGYGGYGAWDHAPIVSAYSAPIAAYHAPVVSAYSAPLYGAGWGYAAPTWGYDLWKKKKAAA